MKKNQKPSYRPIKKKRVNNGLDVEYLKKPFDPYCSSYKENFCNISDSQKSKKPTKKK